jgi:hypothetical protein
LALASVSGISVPLGFAALWGALVYLLAWGSAWLRAAEKRPELVINWPTAADPIPTWLEALLWIGCGALAGVLVVVAIHAVMGDLRETVVVR